MSSSRARLNNNGQVTRFADEAMARFRLVVVGSDADHVKYPDTVQDQPLGLLVDGSDAAEDAVAVAVLGGCCCAAGPVKLNGTCNADDLLTPEDPATAAVGQVRALPTTPGLYWVVGKALEAGLDEQEIEFLPCTPYLVSVNGRATADGTALTNSTVATTLGSQAVALHSLRAGDALRIRAAVSVTAAQSTDTLALTLKVASETVVTLAALDVAANDVAYIDALVVVKTAGVSGVLRGDALTVFGVPGTAVATAQLKDEASEDLSAAGTVTVTGTWSVASNNNSCKLTALSVEVLKAAA